MSTRSWKTWSFIGWAPLLAVLMACATMAGTAQASTAATSPLTFNGNFSDLSPWTTGGGGAQCSNYGTPSQSPRLRGDFNLATNVDGMANAGEFTLPADTSPSTYPLEACDLLTADQPEGLGTDGYYGLMVYVPAGWTIPNNAFDGVEIEEYHFQNVYGAPISFQLHSDHVTLALQTGACNNHTTTSPGCAYHSNADNPNGDPGNVPAQYVIPPGALQEGAWNDMVMHVHWASDGTGQIQTWYKVNSASSWTQSSNVTGIPTVQWDNTQVCCGTSYVDETEAYTSALTAPMSLWLGNDVSGATFNAVADDMTLAGTPTTTTPPTTTIPPTTTSPTAPPVTTPPVTKKPASAAAKPRPTAKQPAAKATKATKATKASAADAKRTNHESKVKVVRRKHKTRSKHRRHHRRAAA
jgi:Polysaccharide lyase